MRHELKKALFVCAIAFMLCMSSTLSFLFIYRSFGGQQEMVSGLWMVQYADSTASDTMHQAAVDGSIRSIFRSRVFVPYMIDIVQGFTGIRTVYLYCMYIFGCLFVSLICLYFLVKKYTSSAWGFFAMALLSSMMPWSYTLQVFYDIFTVMLMCMVLLILSRPQTQWSYLALAAIIFIGTLCKEVTIVFVFGVLISLWCQEDFNIPEKIFFGAYAMACFIIPKFILLAKFGMTDYEFQLIVNLTNIRMIAIFLAFFNIFLFLLGRSFNRMSYGHQKELVIFQAMLIFYILLNFNIGLVGELRTWLFAMPLIILFSMLEFYDWIEHDECEIA